MTVLQQQLQSVFPKLPDAIKDLLLSEDFNDRVEKVAKNHHCDETQTGMLIRLTVRLLSGITPATRFVSGIEEELDISHSEAAFIAQEINRDIFNTVKDALKQVHSSLKAEPADATERPLGTAPIVVKPLLRPDLSALAPKKDKQEPAPTKPVLPPLTPKPEPQARPVLASPPVYATTPRESQPLPKFSVAAALGNIPSTASTQNTPQESATSHADAPAKPKSSESQVGQKSDPYRETTT